MNEFPSHLQRLREVLPTDAGILVTSPENRLWLTSFPFDDGFVFVTRDAAFLLTDSRYIEAAERDVDPAFTVRQMSGPRDEMFLRLCDEAGAREVLFEDASVTVAQCETYRRWFGEKYPLCPAGSLLSDLREMKDESEMDKIVAAQRIAEQAFDHILGYINPERTEWEVALELEFFMRQQGATSVSFPTIAVSGSASSLPHGQPRQVKLEQGFFTMDYGAVYEGYCSDMTRTVVIGHADEEMRALYGTVLRAQMAAEAALREGVTGGELDKIARDIIDAGPYRGCFGHSLGHGVGMVVHEAPSVSARADKPLTRGHVITIEPGIYIKGKYGCRIEDMALFRTTGVEVITRAPREMMEII